MIQQPDVEVPSSDKEPASHDEPAVKSFAEHRVIKHPQTSFIKRLWTSLFGGHSATHAATQEPGKQHHHRAQNQGKHASSKSSGGDKRQQGSNANRRRRSGGGQQRSSSGNTNAAASANQQRKNPTRISKVMVANKVIVQSRQKMKATKKGKPYWLKSKRRNRVY